MKTDNYLKYLIYAGAFIVPFIPLVVADSYFFPFITGKAFMFRIIVECMFAIWLALCLADRRYVPKFNWMTIAVSAFMLIILVADLSGANPFKSIWSNFERMEGWITIVHLWAYFLVLSSVFRNDRIWNGWFNTSIAASAILVLYGFAQLAGKAQIHQGSSRLDATLGNSAYFAVYLLVHIFITAMMLWRTRSNVFLRYVYGLMIFLQLVTLYHTQTRGSILGLIGGLAVSAVLFVIAGRSSKLVRNSAMGALAVIVLIVGTFIVIRKSEFVQSRPALQRLASITRADAAPRFVIWKMAYEGFKEKPLLGWGQESFNYVFNKYYDPKLYAQEQWFDRAHNVFLDWLIAGGILGLLSYLSLFGVALWFIWRKVATLALPERILLTGLLTAYFIHNLFVFDNLISYILFFGLLAFLSSQVEEQQFAPFENFELPDSLRLYVAYPVIAVLLVVGLYYINVIPIKANTTLIDAMREYKDQAGARNLKANLDYFKKALSYRTVGEQETLEQLVYYSGQVVGSDAATDVKKAYYETARSEMEGFIAKHPNDARLNHFMGSFLSRVNLPNDALAYLAKAHELSPNKQTILFDTGLTYARLGDLNKAAATFKQAYDLAPESNEASLFYASSLIYTGQTAEADKVLAKFNGTQQAYDDRIISAYVYTKNYAKVAALFEASIAVEPKSLDLYKSLAAAYLQMGQRAKAIDTLKRAQQNVTSFKEEGDYYIKQIQAGKNP